MMKQYKSVIKPELTTVSNKFIDEYMSKASGDYVKVYLCFLRCEQAGCEADSAVLAELSGLSEGDVNRALCYWEGAGVLQAEDAYQKESASPYEKPMRAQSEEAVVYDAKPEPAEEKKAEEKPVIKQVSLHDYDNDPDFKQLLYVAEMYLNRILTVTDCEIFANLYGGLGMDLELLEYLIEYSINGRHTSLRYMEKVALSWHEKGIRTVEEAKAFSRIISKDAYTVMKAMGLSGRGPGNEELNYIDKWFRTYGFSPELVAEACARTLRNVHTPDFKYADAILSGWKNAKVITKQDVEELDRLHKEKAKTKTPDQMPSRNARVTSNRFHNLEQHGYDYDDMVWSMINPGRDGSEG